MDGGGTGRAARRGLVAGGLAALVVLVLVPLALFGGAALLLQDLGRNDDPDDVRVGTTDDLRGSVAFATPPFDGVPQTESADRRELRATAPTGDDPAGAVLDAAEALGAAGIDWHEAGCRPDPVTGALEIDLAGRDGDVAVGPARVTLRAGDEPGTLVVAVVVPTVDSRRGSVAETVPAPYPECPDPYLDRLRTVLGAR